MSDDRGTYLVRLIPERSGGPVRIGRLGTLTLAGGELLYVGSALGPGGLAARCRHHGRLAAHPHRSVIVAQDAWRDSKSPPRPRDVTTFRPGFVPLRGRLRLCAPMPSSARMT